METVRLSIDGNEVEAQKGMTILEAAQASGIRIPTLCSLKNFVPGGSCRMCMVEIGDSALPRAACTTFVSEGMQVVTNTPSIRDDRKQTLELIASKHRMDCTNCRRFPACELQTLCREFGIPEEPYRFCRAEEHDESSDFLIRDGSKCIVCGRCVAACEQVGLRIWGLHGRSDRTEVSAGAWRLPIDQTSCVACGACIDVCPTGALLDSDQTRPVWNALNHGLDVVFVLDPSLETTLGKFFDGMTEKCVTGKAAALLLRMGVSHVFGLRSAASESLKNAMAEAEKYSGMVFAVDSPSVRKYIEHKSPEALPYMLQTPDPVETFSRMFRQQKEMADSFLVLVTDDRSQKRFRARGIDSVLSVRELSEMLHRACISNFTAMKVWSELQPVPLEELFPERASDLVPRVYGFEAIQSFLAEKPDGLRLLCRKEYFQ